MAVIPHHTLMMRNELTSVSCDAYSQCSNQFRTNRLDFNEWRDISEVNFQQADLLIQKSFH